MILFSNNLKYLKEYAKERVRSDSYIQFTKLIFESIFNYNNSVLLIYMYFTL